VRTCSTISQYSCDDEVVTEIFAHRGLHHVARENTLDAFVAAQDFGVDGVELDVRRTRDGVLVVHHDPHIGDLVIAQHDAHDLPGYVPTLQEAFEVLTTVRVNVEIKNIRDKSEPTYDDTGSFAHQVIASLYDWGVEDRVLISSFDLATCVEVRATDPTMYVGWLLWQQDPLEAVTQAHVLGLNAINPHYSVVNQVVAESARQQGVDLNVWTVNSRLDIEAVAAHQVTSIISDDPAEVLSVIR